MIKFCSYKSYILLLDHGYVRKQRLSDWSNVAAILMLRNERNMDMTLHG